MNMMINSVERGVDRGNCLSLVTIMYLCSARTDKVIMDWIPALRKIILIRIVTSQTLTQVGHTKSICLASKAGECPLPLEGVVGKD